MFKKILLFAMTLLFSLCLALTFGSCDKNGDPADTDKEKQTKTDDSGETAKDDGENDESELGEDGFRYLLLADGTYAVGVGEHQDDATVVIPSTYRGQAVSAILKRGFEKANMSDVTIPEGIKKIGAFAFLSCENLTAVTLPDSVESIGDNAFADCEALSSVTFNAGLQTLEDWAFHGCSALTSLTLPDTVLKIGSAAFENCVALASVDFGNSLEDIGSYAFSGCVSLSCVDLPSTVKVIGSSAFNGCTAIAEFRLHDIQKWCAVTIGSASANPMYFTKNVKVDGAVLTALTLSADVTEIKKYTFIDNESLQSVVFSDKLQSIGVSAFEGCVGLSALSFPDSLLAIGVSAFRGCTGISAVTIPKTTATVGKYAFADCTNLKTVNCQFLDAYAVDKSGNYVTDSDGYIVENTYSGFDYFVFNNCPIEKATIPASICFAVAKTTLKNLTISSGSTVAANAFGGCTSLSALSLPDSLLAIGTYAFSGCTGLTSVTIGNSVTGIGDYAFYHCTGLKTINFDGMKAEWNAISKGEKWNCYLNDKTDKTIPFTVVCTDGNIQY